MKFEILILLCCINGFLYQPGTCRLIKPCEEGQYRMTNGECSHCYQFCYTCNDGQICNACPGDCFNCSNVCTSVSKCNRTDCLSCPDGYYLNNNSKNYDYCQACYYPGCKCTTFTGCDACRLGIYGLQDNCRGICAENCIKCSDSTSCDVCIEGKYGKTCQETCSSNCKTSSCDTNTGRCTDGCKDGYFWNDNKGYCDSCPEKCITCGGPRSCVECQKGYWGNRCEYPCGVCSDDGCDKSVCKRVCSEGYYYYVWENTCHRCPYPYNCKACASATKCLVCKDGYWGFLCYNSCGGCEGLCTMNDGCVSCRNGFHTVPHCHPCSANCRNEVCDSTDGRCTHGCTDGSYGASCTGKCMSQCKTCVNDYQCTSCNGTTYGTYCEKSCLPECQSCSNGTSCESCKDGWYSKDASSRCECSREECSSYRNGVCSSCKQNTTWYAVEDHCCPCSSTCKNSACYENGTCIECPDGKYGDLCAKQCTDKCYGMNCKRNGDCFQCQSGNFGRMCEHTCSKYIPKCSECSGKTTSEVICSVCHKGYFPENDKCTKCNNGCLSRGNDPTCFQNNGMCIFGCKRGWSGHKCDTQCAIDDCKTCNVADMNQCVECNDGLYSANSSFCKHCPINCDASHGCYKHTGICLACTEKWSGAKCDVPCPPNCVNCNQDNHKQCKVCTESNYGVSCENHCSDTCVRIENKATCDKDSGQCLLGCLARYWGDTCSSKCGQGCSGTVCNQTNGDCLGNCEQIYYGHACDKMCSTTCSEIAFHNRTCHNISGECLGGCKSGYYGAECTEICSSNCNRSLCFKENGTCTHGCVGDFRGPACTKALQSVDSSPTSTAAAIGGGIAAAVVVVIIAAIVAVVAIKRRRFRRANVSTEHSPRVFTIDSQGGKDNPVYMIHSGT